MKKKKEMLNPVEKEILIKGLYLWQDAFVKEIKSIEKKGNISMFHPNWTNIMLREFALKFDIDELPTHEGHPKWKNFSWYDPLSKKLEKSKAQQNESV